VDGLPVAMAENGFGEIGRLFSPEVQAVLPPDLKLVIQQVVAQGVGYVFWTVTISAILCLMLCLLLPSSG
jgi:hypothetical protein